MRYIALLRGVSVGGTAYGNITIRNANTAKKLLALAQASTETEG